MAGLKVLLLEDSQPDAVLEMHELRQAGFEPDCRRVDTEAEFLGSLDESPDLIIADYHLPQFDALRALRLVRERGLDVPVIVVSGTIGEEEAVECLRQGAADYLLKDRLSRLGHAVARALDEKRLRDQERAAEAELRASEARFRTLHEIAQGILSSRSPEEIARGALRGLRSLVACQRASVILYDFERYEGLVLAVDQAGSTDLGPGMRVPLDSFMSIPALRAGRRYAIHDLAAMGRRSPVEERMLAEGLRSTLRLALVAQDTLIGALNLSRATPGAFAGEDQDVAAEVADQLAIALFNARLLDQVRRHAAELERQVQERTAELRERNAELEAFSSSISHDLRTPLRALEGFAQALLEDYGPQLDASGQDYAERIAAAARRMDELIQDLLDYSRLSRAELQLQPVEVSDVVAEALGHVDAELRERQAVVSVEPPLPRAVAHPAALSLVLANLLSNAAKFVAADTQPRIRVWAEETALDVRLCVEDNGLGIAPEHQERIFRVFERLHGRDEYPGTGIGLAVVRRGVERLGGRAGVESEPGRGSRFWITLRRPDNHEA